MWERERERDTERLSESGRSDNNHFSDIPFQAKRLWSYQTLLQPTGLHQIKIVGWPSLISHPSLHPLHWIVRIFCISNRCPHLIFPRSPTKGKALPSTSAVQEYIQLLLLIAKSCESHEAKADVWLKHHLTMMLVLDTSAWMKYFIYFTNWKFWVIWRRF